MITPHLEKLIWEGKAFFKTFVAGGAKSTLNIGQDRFIVITDITYMPSQGQLFFFGAVNCQLSIYGEKGFNHYIFRNNNATLANVYDPVGGVINVPEITTLQPTTINTYLIHTTQVGFSFIWSQGPGLETSGVASVDNPSLAPPLDYGTQANPGAITIQTDFTCGTLLNQVTNRQGGALPVGTIATQQVQFEASGSSVPFVQGNPYFPVANVNYIEILGQPNNIGF